MPILRQLHVASTGTKQTRTGEVINLSSDDIAEMAQSYKPYLHQCKVSVDDVATAVQLGAPVVLGHLDPRSVEAKGAMPSFGKVLNAQQSDEGLTLDVELTDAMAGWLQDELYDHVSLSWYDRDDSRNPTPGKLHLRHIGFLGAEPSAMKDLRLPNAYDLEFCEADVYQNAELIMVAQVKAVPAVLEFSESSMTSNKSKDMAEPAETDAESSTVDPVLMMTSIMADGDKGYKGEISEYRPVPTADNSYLWNEDLQQFAGQFVDISGNEEEVYDFVLQLEQDGSMTRSYKRLFATDGAQLADSTVEAEAAVAETAPEALEATSSDKELEAGEKCAAKQSKELSEFDMPVPMAEGLPELTLLPYIREPAAELQMTTLTRDEYQTLLAKAEMADVLAAEKAALLRQAKHDEIREALEPLYDLGLIDPYVESDRLANAILSMNDAATSICLEFSEGAPALDSPLAVVLATFSQIAQRSKAQSETEIEFGEMSMPSPKASKQSGPSGTVADPEMDRLDTRAREICTEKGCKPSGKAYIDALKQASRGE